MLGRIIATIEARMGSRRLPGKVLKEAVGRPLLDLMVERVRRSRYIDEVVVATSTSPADDAIVDLCQRAKIAHFRGSEEDVLARVIGAQRQFGAQTCVLLTGDCPLIDPFVVDHIVCAFLEAAPLVQYASNCEVKSYPIGLDTQVVSFETLEESSRLGEEAQYREHVGWYIRRHPDKYRRVDVVAPPGLSNPYLRITLDYAEDYERIRAIYEELYPRNPRFTTVDVLAARAARLSV